MIDRGLIRAVAAKKGFDVFYVPEIQGAAIVLLGSFNPAIFSPAWLEKCGVINEQQLAEAKTNIITEEISQFSCEDVTYTVTQERFTIQRTSEPYIQLLDDVVNIFRGQLPHTPIQSFGLNLDLHFKLDRPERRVALGRALAPLSPWRKFGERIASAKGMETGGVVSLTIREICTDDREIGHRNVKIEPSVRMHSLAGVYMQVNDHYGFKNKLAGSDVVIRLLEQRFDNSMAESKRIISDLMDFARDLEC